MIQVVVNGARGRMGALVVATVRASPGLQLVGELGRTDDLEAVLQKIRPDVVVDFTQPECVFANTRAILRAACRPVIGTSGLTADQFAELAQECRERRVGGIVAPNFALGAVLMMRFSAEAARHFATAEILETHHPRKLDAPSGTALETARRIAAASGSPATTGADSRPSRGMESCGLRIHSLRLPGVVAEQEVVFGSIGEVLRIEHRTYSRDAFMPGVILACRTVVDLCELVLGLDAILDRVPSAESR